MLYMEKRDVIIVGTGAAGLFCALNIPPDKKTLLITKDAVSVCDSSLAQGGICVLKDANDYDSFFEDTMKAGHYENRKTSVDLMIRNSREVIGDLIDYGVEFERENGELSYTREGAHSTARILYHEDLTGKEITGKMFLEVKKRQNIEIAEFTTMVDLLCKDNVCCGVIVSDKNGTIKKIEADYVVLATGGLGGIYESSTNYPHLTGDGIAIALKHGIEVRDLNYIQVHPTTFYSKKAGRRFLISESVRGEGAVLLNKNGERFADELLPRDLLTKEIYQQMEADKSKFVWLSLKHMDPEMVKKRFPNIYQHCLEEGYDLTKDWIPVTPAQHYLMGGIAVDSESKTSMDRLYAIGETSNNGVHGANRLASNSLLESLVFAKRAANDITENYRPIGPCEIAVDSKAYADLKKLQQEYKRLIKTEIDRESSHE